MNKNINKLSIGCLTFHRAINYGALLQTYALQEVFRKFGCEYTVIDYRSSCIEKKHKEMNIHDCKTLKDILRWIFYSKHHNNKINKFRDFASRHINLSMPYYSIEELSSAKSMYDKFICGSDQVWNSNITDLDKVYFLDFVDDSTQKNSYAASFGFKSIPLQFREDYCNLLKDFNCISVREEQGRKIIKDLIHKEVDVVLDPTLLISEEEWNNVTIDYTKKKNYILLYAFGGSTHIKHFVENLSHKTGCEVVYLSHSLKKDIKATYEKCIGPSEFLGLFKNARYVVTNSFHGTCFSINYKKDFFLEMLPESQNVNSRLENILDLFDLRDRQIQSGVANDKLINRIDYNRVNEKLIIERNKSLSFIQRIIES